MNATIAQRADQMAKHRVLVIIGSVRARRVGPQIAEWAAQIGREVTGAQFELVDLKDWPLSMSEEPGIPAIDDYVSEHTRSRSRKVAGADAFVFVTPQYNWGYPAPLKNALDHLYKEWATKPAVIVTYGGHGGGKCGRQLNQVLKGLKMRPITVRPVFTLTHDQIKANTGHRRVWQARCTASKSIFTTGGEIARREAWTLVAPLVIQAGL